MPSSARSILVGLLFLAPFIFVMAWLADSLEPDSDLTMLREQGTRITGVVVERIGDGDPSQPRCLLVKFRDEQVKSTGQRCVVFSQSQWAQFEPGAPIDVIYRATAAGGLRVEWEFAHVVDAF